MQYAVLSDEFAMHWAQNSAAIFGVRVSTFIVLIELVRLEMISLPVFLDPLMTSFFAAIVALVTACSNLCDPVKFPILVFARVVKRALAYGFLKRLQFNRRRR